MQVERDLRRFTGKLGTPFYRRDKALAQDGGSECQPVDRKTVENDADG